MCTKQKMRPGGRQTSKAQTFTEQYINFLGFGYMTRLEILAIFAVSTLFAIGLILFIWWAAILSSAVMGWHL